MTSRSPLRTFLEQELVAADKARPGLGLDAALPTDQVVSHLVEQTVCRAALDAATQRPAVEYSSEETADVSWKHCLLVAALTELRPVKLLARN